MVGNFFRTRNHKNYREIQDTSYGSGKVSIYMRNTQYTFLDHEVTRQIRYK